MKQLTYIKKNVLQWWDVEEPTLQSAQEAIVRPIAAARCDLEKAYLFNDYSRLIQLGVALHYLDPVTTDLLGPRPFAGPFAVGHECVAEVVRVGGEVQGFARGDKVIVPWAISCGRCLTCQVGLTSRCADAGETLLSAYGFGTSMGPWGGMVSDVVRVPFAQQMLVHVPTGIDPVALASASDNIPDAWRAVGPLLKQRPGAPVLVLGGSAVSIALYAAAIAVAMDASQVDYVDHDPARLAIAATLGANPIAIPRRGRDAWYRRHAPRRGGIYPIAVDAASNAEALRFALRSLAPGGVCTSVGMLFQRNTSIPLMQMYANDSTLRTGISHPRADLPAVLELIRSGRFQPQKITTVLANWSDAAEAWLERTTKVVVHRPALHAR